MKRQTALAHEFVEYMPDQLKDGILYVSMPFATVTHKCCYGKYKHILLVRGQKQNYQWFTRTVGVELRVIEGCG